MYKAIQTADLDWQSIDGIEIPVSKVFGDIYFSKDNGLLETRHVFMHGNHLPERLSKLQEYEYFCVGETGFGTGLNILSLWQLWQQVRPDNHSHLHIVSVEKFPLSKTDLIRALKVWPELADLSEQLIEQYPLAIAGCHRLSFPSARFSIDLWFGDAHDIFPNIVKTCAVNAWFLDGFAPSCNPDLWEEHVLKHIVRLSDIGTTFASFSVAGVLKRGLTQHGISISRPRGFGHKREMLKGVWLAPDNTSSDHSAQKNSPTHDSQFKQRHTDPSQYMRTDLSNDPVNSRPRQIAIIGAGIAGLSCAHAFAQHGHKITIFDQSAPLSGASGNPLALLNPKLSAIEKSAEHLMTMSWRKALQYYSTFRAFRPVEVSQMIQKNPEDIHQLCQQYPSNVLEKKVSNQLSLLTSFDSLELKQAGAVDPHQLAEEILKHPNIEFVQADIQACTQHTNPTQTQNSLNNLTNTSSNRTFLSLTANPVVDQRFDHVIVCTALASKKFFTHYPVLKPIRGQVSWVENTDALLDPNHAYSYGGYCMQLNAEHLILGASFYPDRDDVAVCDEDHQHNLELLQAIFPDYAAQLQPIAKWQGRASVRAQSLDYFPLVGKIQDDLEVYTLSGLGSRGFLYAPLCSDILVAEILKHAYPVPRGLLNKLSAKRFQKKIKPKKPYYQPPSDPH